MAQYYKVNINVNVLMLIVSIAFVYGFTNKTWAQSPQKAMAANNTITYECTDASIGLTENSNLTREEKVEKMDHALFVSLSKYDACQNQRQGASANSGGTSGGEPSSAGGSSQSVAANDMSGEEKPMSDKNSQSETESLMNADALIQSELISESDGGGANAKIASTDNGKIPDGIPPADNDSVLEAQIRQAAISEKDPKTRNKLWKEYRKYKGLPESK